MAIKTILLTEAYPNSGFSNHKSKSSLFAYASVQYWNVAKMAAQQKKEHNTPVEYVELPLMHMSLELSAKALASYFDERFDSKRFGHRTYKIIEYYSKSIKSFKVIIEDQKQLELVKSLEVCWLSIRYAESFFQYYYEDWIRFNEMMLMLTDEYRSISGLPI